MENNYIVSARQIQEEQYNATVLHTEGISQFLTYYTLILMTSVSYGLLTEKTANRISNLILVWITNDQDNNPEQIANQLYLLTCYLKSKDTNMTRLNRLLCLNGPQDVNKLFLESNAYFKSEVSKMPVILNLTKEVVKKSKLDYADVSNPEDTEKKLDHSYISSTLRTLETQVNDLTRLACNLKDLHAQKGNAFYSTAKKVKKEDESEEPDCLTRLSAIVRDFSIEMSLISRLGGRDIMDYVDSIMENRITANELRDYLEEEISSLEKEISTLKKQYEEDLIHAKDLEEIFLAKQDEIEEADRKAFKKLHSSLSDAQFEEAFEEWQENLPEDHFDVGVELIDEIELTEKYQREIQHLQNQLDKAEKRLESEVSNHDADEYSDMGVISLDKVLIIRAIIIASKRSNRVKLPGSFEELAHCLTHLDRKKAIEIILSDEEISLSDSEKDYLKELF